MKTSKILTKQNPSLKRDTLNGVFTLNYDCPYGQVMSYKMLRIVMIGFAKLEVNRAIIS